MKKTITAILALVMTISMAACGSSDDQKTVHKRIEGNTQTNITTTTAPTPTTTTTTTTTTSTTTTAETTKDYEYEYDYDDDYLSNYDYDDDYLRNYDYDNRYDYYYDYDNDDTGYSKQTTTQPQYSYDQSIIDSTEVQELLALVLPSLKEVLLDAGANVAFYKIHNWAENEIDMTAEELWNNDNGLIIGGLKKIGAFSLEWKKEDIMNYIDNYIIDFCNQNGIELIFQ